MATIYRFIVEQRGRGGSGNGGASKKSTAKTITPLKMLTGGAGGGANNNRSMRGINALMNSAIPNYEKGVRFAKASLGLVKLKQKENGGYAFAGISGTALAVLFVLMLRIAMAHHKKLIEKEERNNNSNYKKLETGQTAIHGQFNVVSNFWSGKLTFNENK